VPGGHPLQGQNDGDWLSAIVNDFVAQSAERHGLLRIDLVPCIQAEERLLPDVFYLDDGLHMTPWGKRAAGRCLARSLPPLLEGLEAPD